MHPGILKRENKESISKIKLNKKKWEIFGVS